MFNYTLEDIINAKKVYSELEIRLESLMGEFGMRKVNGKIYILDSYSFGFNVDERELTILFASKIDNPDDTLSFPFPTSWIWDEQGSHKNAYQEWINSCPKI